VTYFSVLVALADSGRLTAALDSFDANSVATLSAYVREDVQAETVDGISAYYYMSTRNREAELDGWKIGGGWSLRFKPRRTGDQDLIYGEAPVSAAAAADAEGAFAGWAAGGRKISLDIKGTRNVVGALAAREWDTFDGQRKQHPPALGWSSFLAPGIAEPDAYPITRARADYHAQPLAAALERDRPFLAPCPVHRVRHRPRRLHVISAQPCCRLDDLTERPAAREVVTFLIGRLLTVSGQRDMHRFLPGRGQPPGCRGRHVRSGYNCQVSLTGPLPGVRYNGAYREAGEDGTEG
jgi:hypothetical protein